VHVGESSDSERGSLELRGRVGGNPLGWPYKRAPFRRLQHELLSVLTSVSSRFFSHPPRPLDLPVALPTGEAGRSSARQSHDLRLPGPAKGWLGPPEARPPDRALALPG
jgi:hypothetical protein